jgi:heme-degrading monooxygenase HmoA
MTLAETPEPPYFAVVFTSQRTLDDDVGYAAMAEVMENLARQQPGYLGIESARDARGFGITVSYWASLEAIVAWRENVEHRVAQGLGREHWYEAYSLRVCEVKRAYGFER